MSAQMSTTSLTSTTSSKTAVEATSDSHAKVHSQGKCHKHDGSRKSKKDDGERAALDEWSDSKFSESSSKNGWSSWTPTRLTFTC